MRGPDLVREDERQPACGRFVDDDAPGLAPRDKREHIRRRVAPRRSFAQIAREHRVARRAPRAAHARARRRRRAHGGPAGCVHGPACRSPSPDSRATDSTATSPARFPSSSRSSARRAGSRPAPRTPRRRSCWRTLDAFGLRAARDHGVARKRSDDEHPAAPAPPAERRHLDAATPAGSAVSWLSTTKRYGHAPDAAPGNCGLRTERAPARHDHDVRPGRWSARRSPASPGSRAEGSSRTGQPNAAQEHAGGARDRPGRAAIAAPSRARPSRSPAARQRDRGAASGTGSAPGRRTRPSSDPKLPSDLSHDLARTQRSPSCDVSTRAHAMTRIVEGVRGFAAAELDVPLRFLAVIGLVLPP